MYTLHTKSANIKVTVRTKCLNGHEAPAFYPLLVPPRYTGKIPVKAGKTLGKCPECNTDIKTLEQTLYITNNGQQLSWYTKLPNEKPAYALILGAATFIGTNGTFILEEDEQTRIILKINELYQEDVTNSRLSIDIDVNTKNGEERIIMSNNEQVIVTNESSISIINTKTRITVKDNNQNNPIVIDAEQFDVNNHLFVDEVMDLYSHGISNIIRINGAFSAGKYIFDLSPSGLFLSTRNSDGTIEAPGGFINITFSGPGYIILNNEGWRIAEEAKFL